MSFRVLILKTAAIVASASAGAQSPAVFSTGDTSGEYNASGTWGVSPDGIQVNVHWLCPAFEHDTNPAYQADLQAALTSTGNAGATTSQVIQSTGSTNLDGGQTTTSLLATAAGVGVANFQIDLQLNDPLSAEGAYETTIQVTLTAP